MDAVHEAMKHIGDMPSDIDGMVKDPRYVPESRRDAYLKKWGEYFRSHTYREPWMNGLIAEYRNKAKHG